jgi:ABC-type spermidine/putrescine transport system permease subunit II
MNHDTMHVGGRVWLWVVAWLIVAFLLLPIVIIVIVSFGNSAYLEFPPRSWSLRWYREFFTSARWLDSSILSFKIGLATCVTSTVLGTLAAIGFVRGQNRAKKAIELFLVSPMVTPSIVLALGLYFLFSAFQLLNSPIAIFLGHTVVATPLVFIIVAGALRTLNVSLDMAARSLGAGPFQALWHITLPLIRPAVTGGAAFAFLTSFDEVVIAVFLGGPQSTTLPKRMWDGVRFETDPTLTAVATLLIVLAVLVVGAAEVSRRISSRRQGGARDTATR